MISVFSWGTFGCGQWKKLGAWGMALLSGIVGRDSEGLLEENDKKATLLWNRGVTPTLGWTLTNHLPCFRCIFILLLYLKINEYIPCTCTRQRHKWRVWEELIIPEDNACSKRWKGWLGTFKGSSLVGSWLLLPLQFNELCLKEDCRVRSQNSRRRRLEQGVEAAGVLKVMVMVATLL